MPMAIIQYLNNSLMQDKGIDAWSTFNILSFISSISTIGIYCITLIKFLFQEDAEILWE